MCGRYTLIQWEELCARFGITLAEALVPRFNIAPTQPVPVIVREGDEAVCRLFRWGLVPYWAKDISVGNKMINARAETVREKPSYRGCFRQRRCLVPADGFFEWKREGKKKQPYWFTRADGGLFAMAGLWEEWRPPQGEPLRSVTIITTAANSLVAPVHERMPVILPKKAEAEWLKPAGDLTVLAGLLAPFPAEEMACRAVSPLVNSPHYDSPDVLSTLL